MGLDTTHDAFSGAYSAFNRVRQAVAESIGGSWPPHSDKSLDDDFFYWPGGTQGSDLPGLETFFSMSDCDGEIPPEMCGALADEMERLVLPNLKEKDREWGHIARDGGMRAVLERWIAGCRRAHEACEPLEFR